MTYNYEIDFSFSKPVNYLWPNLNDSLGVEKANEAVHQAIDLQLMNGNISTLPVLFLETCGIALVRIDTLRKQTGVFVVRSRTVLLFSIKMNCFQLINEV